MPKRTTCVQDMYYKNTTTNPNYCTTHKKLVYKYRSSHNQYSNDQPLPIICPLQQLLNLSCHSSKIKQLSKDECIVGNSTMLHLNLNSNTFNIKHESCIAGNIRWSTSCSVCYNEVSTPHTQTIIVHKFIVILRIVFVTRRQMLHTQRQHTQAGRDSESALLSNSHAYNLLLLKQQIHKSMTETIPLTPISQPLMTSPAPRRKEKGDLDLSNVFPFSNLPWYMTPT